MFSAVNVPSHVNQSIEAMADLHGRDERTVTAHQRGIERLGGALGRPRLLYATIVFVTAWMGLNLALPAHGRAAFDPPPFHYLHIVLTLGALLMATIVLIVQDRQVRMSDKRSHLDLQINLLAEGKIAKVIALLEELRRDLPNVRNRQDAEASAMASRIDPQVVSAALEVSILGDLDASDDHPDPPATATPALQPPAPPKAVG